MCISIISNSVFSFRYLLNIPGPLDIPAHLCKGNFDDEVLNHQVPYLWLIYWWDLIYCGEKCCILGSHLLFITELQGVKINLMLKSLNQNWKDAKVYPLLKKKDPQKDSIVIISVMFKIHIVIPLPNRIELQTYNVFLHFLNSLCHPLQSSIKETVEAYEAALGVAMRSDIVQKIWME